MSATLAADSHAAPSGNVVCVIVTYADRRTLLRTVLDALPAQGVSRAVVADNGARWSVRPELTASYGDFVDVVEMGRNTGSAPGFAAGMRRAIEIGAEFIWLLDDDNLPAEHSLKRLITGYRDASVKARTNIIAVCGYRSGIYSRYINDIEYVKWIKPEQCFLGFHFANVIRKLLITVVGERRRPKPDIGDGRFQLAKAAYGGLLFHRSLIGHIGLPRSDFILYEDDTEWTSRICRRGGSIFLIAGVVIEDLETSWVTAKWRGSGFVAWVFGENQFKVYYSIRNKVYLSKINMHTKSAAFILNAVIYILAINLFCMIFFKFKRLRLIMRAIFDGYKGQLGVKSNIDM